MSRTAVVTDSNSGITQKQAGELGLHVLPMPFIMDGEGFFEDISLTQELFYDKLNAGASISTSQPSLGALLDLWNKLLKEHDEVVHIPMSSGLSASYESAAILSREFEGRVQVADNKRISVTQRQSALEAKALANTGLGAKEIKTRLEETGMDSSIYIMVNTLKYLKQGGRITPAVAAIGTLLNIKPVLQIHGGKLDQYAKVRSVKQGRAAIIEAIRNDMNNKHTKYNNPQNMTLGIAYTYDRNLAMEFKAEVEAAFPGYKTERVDPLSLSVSCHIGPGALALTCTRKITAH
jgi:DegV family protein with EDD domain